MEEYIVSARKYRPNSFDTVVGQKALTTTLKNAVKSGKLAHAYLFCGPRGVGKTTCARIFAKAINCQSPTDGGEACNHCESCQAFNEQRSYNIFELDAASNNSVENIKALMEQTRIPPQVGRYKVFIIDEVHMLSTQAFNAFLKTLEEPPAHVIFILATTEKHKILPTILSRCQIYDFDRMTVPETISHLKNVADKEGITYEDEALSVIAEKADGGMRDALSIFDQCASFCQGNITYQKVIEDLNVLDSDYYFRIVDHAVSNQVSDIMLLLNEIVSKGFDPGNMMLGLAKHIRNVMMARDQATLPLLEVSQQQRQKFAEQAKRCPTNFLYKALQLLNKCDINYRQAGDKRLLVEITLIEIAQITQPDDEPDAGRRPGTLKILFQHLLRNQPQKSAQQVAAAGTQTNGAAATANAPKPTQPQQPAAARPKLKLGNITNSWQRLRTAAQAKQPTDQPIDIPTEEHAEAAQKKENFTQADLEREWMAMCLRMPQQYTGIAARMKNMKPTITQYPAVAVTADSEFTRNDLMRIAGSIVATLKLYLGNPSITLTVNMAQQTEHVKALSRAEIFKQMAKENPTLEKLREMLDLELA